MARTALGLTAGGPARAAAGLAIACGALLACGVIHKDIDVTKEFTAGGGPPTAEARIDGSELTAPLAASQGDLAHLSAVTLRSARLEATDQGDLSFVSGGTIVISGNNNLPDATLGTLAAPAGARADFKVDSARDLKPYLLAGALLNATINYAQRPVTARGLRLTLTIRGGL